MDPTSSQYDRALAGLKEQSLALLDRAGDRVWPLVDSGILSFHHLRGPIVELFMKVNPDWLSQATGHDLRVPVRLTKLLVFVVSPLLLLLSVVLSFVAFGWWGALSAVLAPLAYAWGMTSNSTGTGLFNPLLAVGFIIGFFVAASGPAQHLWSASVALWSLSQFAYYLLAVAAVDRVARTSPTALRAFVDLELVALREVKPGV